MSILKSENDWLWYRFVNIKGVGNILRDKLLDRYGHPEAVFAAPEKDLSELLSPAQIRGLIRSGDRSAHESRLRQLEENRIRFLLPESDLYPDRLRTIAMPPQGLYVRGRLPDPHAPAIAVVGSRKATNYGKSAAASFAADLARCGVAIISGLAAGVDTEGHKGALSVGGYTAGVLGGGIDTIYPRGNFNLYYELYRAGGVISEYNIGIPNQSGLFPMRNRIISGLSDGILVIEADERSGSLITAGQGLDQGKEVFAIPGRITDRMSRGTNRLIADGAIPVADPEDILYVLSDRGYRFSSASDKKDYGEVITDNNAFRGNSPGGNYSVETADRADVRRESDHPENHILDYIDEVHPISFDHLREETALKAGRLQKLLLELEMEDMILQPVQGLYLKKSTVCRKQGQ